MSLKESGSSRYVDLRTRKRPSFGPQGSQFRNKLHFSRVMPMYPGRAVFSFPKSGSWPIDLHTTSTIFTNLRRLAGPGRLGEADRSRPGGRLRLFEKPAGLFVIQVRAGVGDCAISGLGIDTCKWELSFEWRDIFSQFFGEKRATDAVLNGAPVSSISLRRDLLVELTRSRILNLSLMIWPCLPLIMLILLTGPPCNHSSLVCSI